MAYITFIARNQRFGACRLDEAVELGRSFDCGIFVPDIFVSRKHCRFEPCPQGWMIVDLQSQNGLHFRGRKIARRILHDGDVVEMGTIAIIYHAGPLQESTHTTTPFGDGTPVLELVDTLCAAGTRPVDFVRRNKRAPREFVRYVEEPYEERYGDEVELDLEMQIAEGSLHQVNLRPQLMGERSGDWTELDVEWQVESAPRRAAEIAAVAEDPDIAALDASLPSLDSSGERMESLRGRSRPMRTPPGGRSADGAGTAMLERPTHTRWKKPLWTEPAPAPAKAEEKPSPKTLWEQAKEPAKAKEEAIVRESTLRDRAIDLIGELRKVEMQQVLRWTIDHRKRIAAVLVLSLGISIGGRWGYHRIMDPKAPPMTVNGKPNPVYYRDDLSS